MKNISLKGLVLGLFVSIVSVMECTISAAPGYVDDPSVSVPAGAYTTFSTVYNGKRYYLGIDTIKAASGIDTVAAYDRPCYAAMWKVDSLYSPNGARLADKNYQRTIQSVWIEEKCSGRKRYLSLGENKGTYSAIVLRDAAAAAMWYTEQDNSEQSKYIQGYLYYHSDATGVYRYLTYDPLYGFRRAYARKPSASQRISVWDRKTGSDLIYKMTPTTITFGYSETDREQPITSQVIYYTDVDRFRSRYDQVDIYVRRSEPITNQQTLVSDYGLVGHFEWRSNPMDHTDATTIAAYDGNSLMPYYTITNYDDSDPENPIIEWGWQNLPVVHARKDGFKLEDNIWYDAIYAIASPIDDPEGGVRFLRKPDDGGAPTEGAYTNQNDWLYTHFTCAGKEYIDSVYVVFQTFHTVHSTTLETEAVLEESPESSVEGITFPYRYNGKMWDEVTPATTADISKTLTINARYTAKSQTVSSISNVVNSSEKTYDLDLLDRDPIVEDGVTYNALEVVALEADGVTPCSWITVTTSAKNEIQISVAEYDPDTLVDRVAQVQYTYRYMNTKDHTDIATATRTIWITQEWKGAHSSDPVIYSFEHKNTEADGLQAVHEKHNTFYAIPGEDLSLPLHRDHWGYYRWFIYDEGAKRDRDIKYMNTWDYAMGADPTSNETPARQFMLINQYSGTTSRGRWDMIKDIANPTNPIYTNDHFVQWTATHVPAVKYPERTAESLTKSGKIACDVSEYFDVATTGVTGSSLTAMTEPTLSYRQVFDIHPAKERADQLAAVKGDGNGANWLENHTVVVPAGREFFIQPQCPIDAVGADDINEEHLQYIYYANPTKSKIGTREDLTNDHLQHNEYYARVGVKKPVGRHVKLTLITKEMLENLGDGKYITNVMLINPRNSTGFIIGNDDRQSPCYMDYNPYKSTKAELEAKLEAKILSQPKDDAYDDYYLTIWQSGSGDDKRYFFSKGSYRLYDLYTAGIGYNVRWYPLDPTGSEMFTMDKYKGNLSDSNLPSGYETGDMLTFYANWSKRDFGWGIITRNHEGYLKAESKIISDVPGSWNPYYAWLLYKVEILHDTEFEEIPRWERWNGSAWKEVARWNYTQNKSVSPAGVTGYEMTANGALHMDDKVLPDTGTNFSYRLRTEHFQLAKFTGITRPADTEMLKLGTIISEDDIERDYNIIFSLDMENWSKPGTSEVTAYNYHFPWDFTELSYHYPVGDGKNEVPAQKRIFKKAIPGKGEYCFLNKFVVPSKEEAPNTDNNGEVFECMAGAENGYMLCVNAAHKRTTIMNFEYDQLSCSGQQIYLVGNYCNPINNPYDPQITADLEGWDGSKWTPIYRYKSGKIKYHPASEQHWYQMALPIARERIEGYSKFRCRAEIDGAANKNCHLLIDRLRFIEKARGFTVFQDKATCIKDDSVTVLIRLNYNADPDLYKPGKLVAYQFQKWDKTANKGAGGYVPMNASIDNGDGTYTALDETTEPKLQVAPGYMKDAFTTKESVETPWLKTLAKNDYGYVMIPEPDYDPSKSNTDGGQSALRRALIEQAIEKLGLTGDAVTARRAFINEKGNVRTFDQVMNNDLLFGGATPHVKSFVKEGDNWVIYLATRLPISATQNNTFRVGMAVMNDLNDKPTFTEEACATFHIFKVKQTTALNVNGALWTNHPRSWYDDETPGKELLAANETYRASIALQLDETVFGNNTANPRCKFDLLHATENVRANDAAGNAAFEAKYGCTRTQFKDDMEAFRNDDERNTIREVTDWSQVTWQDFTKTGRTEDVAKAIYNRLNHLVTNGLLEIGLDYRDIYMGDRADSYFYLIPVPATGRYESLLGNHDASADTTMLASVCNDTLWLELHSQEPTAKLRFGYDSRIGDTYIVPTIRASRTDANEHLKVRVAEISTSSDAASVVIGWEKTELIDSNDPAWTGTQVFKYKQDKDMRTHNPNEFEYYKKGDEITFTPQTSGNNITLKAGYWYQFKAPFYAVSKLDKYTADPATPTGHSQFILAIAPDTVRWTPSHPDAANYWNDDANWTPVMHNTPEGGFKATVPMGDTRVIIPQTAEGELPVVNDDVIESKDTLHYGYAKNTCKEILFYPRATMLGQEKLNYEKAFVDLLLLQGQWQTFAPALKNIYSGDMYIPETVKNDKDFLPEVFEKGTPWSSTHNRTWPYAFYQGFYNTTVPVVFHNTDIEGNPMEETTKSSADWVKTNVLDQPYQPGEAVILLGFGPNDEAEGTELVVRLPKQETSYHYIGQNGQVGQSVTLARPAFSAINKNLYYDKDNLGDKEGITKTLSNETASKVFFFGNSTMAPVDIWELCNDNKDVIEAGGTPNSYRFTAYLLGEGASYSTNVVTGPGQFFVAPQRAVGLIAKEAANSINIILKPSAMVAMTESGETIHNPNAKRGGTARTATKVEAQPQEAWLYISAANMTDDGLSKAYYTLGCNATAARGYKEGEDALSLVSGLNYYNAGSLATPLSMYSIADNRPVMLDVRDTVSMVPLAFTTLDEHYSYDEVTLLSFATKGKWNGPLYLYDALTGDSVMIIDGIQVAIQTPENDQVRYYINHNIVPITEPVIDPVDPITTSTAEVNKQTVASNYAEVYDLLGRRVAVMQKNELIHHLGLPTGVYVIQRGTEVEKIVVR